MTEGILVVNAGSSTLKFSLFTIAPDGPALDIRGQMDGIFTAPHLSVKDCRGETIYDRSWTESFDTGHESAVDRVIDYLMADYADFRVLAVGHRVTHGGLKFTAPVRVTPASLAELEELIPLAPMHQPRNLAIIRRALDRNPRIPQIACFDTAFHRAAPRVSQLFGLPLDYADAGVIRYGFHGLSYEYIASALPNFDERAAAGKTIVLHLGNGASMCALAERKSVASTMGFSVLDGLIMGTRSGSLDPGILLYLMNARGMDSREIENLFYHRSGLLGISGVSSDMRDLLKSEEPHAKLAVDLFVYRIGREMGSLAAALGGLDAIVFTGGIGEHSAPIRERVCETAAWLGVKLNRKSNRRHGPRISSMRSMVAAWVIPTDEELDIARHTVACLRSESMI